MINTQHDATLTVFVRPVSIEKSPERQILWTGHGRLHLIRRRTADGVLHRDDVIGSAICCPDSTTKQIALTRISPHTCSAVSELKSYEIISLAWQTTIADRVGTLLTRKGKPTILLLNDAQPLSSTSLPNRLEFL